MTLYDLEDQMRQLLIMAEDEEIDEETFKDTMESLTGEFEDKADGIAMVLRQLKADGEAIKVEEDRLKARRKALENKADWLKRYLQFGMELTGLKKFKTALFSFGIQKNQASVKIDDLAGIPECYLKPHKLTEDDVDKAAIKALLQSGDAVECSFAHLEQTTGLRIR